MREWIYLHVGSNLPQYFRMGILLCVIWTIQSLMYFTNEVLLRKCTPRNLGFPGGSVIRIHLPMQDIQETWAQSLIRKTPWKREWQPTPVLLPGKSHRQKSLGGYGPGNCKELYMTEHAHHEIYPLLPYSVLCFIEILLEMILSL